MSAKCSVCGKAIVSKKGQVCIACQVKQNSMQGNLTTPDIQKTYTTGQPKNLQTRQETQQPMHTQPIKPVKKKNTGGEYYGTVHNFQRTEIKKNAIWKWLHALWYGVPYSKSDIQYEFTLYEGDGMTAVGISGHEVVMYGDAGYTLLSDNSIVRGKGRKDKNGVVMASEIIGVNTGFHLRPKAAISPQVVRVLTVLCVLLLVAGIFLMTRSGNPPEAAQTANTASQAVAQQTTNTQAQGNTMQTSNAETQTSTMQTADAETQTSTMQTANTATQSTSRFSIEKLLIAVIAFLAAALMLKSQVQKRWKYGTMLILLGLGMFSEVFLLLFVGIIVYWLLKGKKEK